MTRLLPIFLLLCLPGCGGKEIELKYEEPTNLKYTNSNNVQDYKKAFRAGWEEKMLSYETDFEEGLTVTFGTHQTCCEATEEVTEGWYAGMDYGQKFFNMIESYDTSPRIKSEFLKKIKANISANRTKDWYKSAEE